jgi:hypothetical protein
MPLSADVTFDVAVDAELHRALPQTFGTPPEDEAETCGALFFGEADVLDPAITFVNIPGPIGPEGPPGGDILDGFEMPLGDDPDTANTGPWTAGAVTLTPVDSVSHAISLINRFLAGGLGAQDGFDLPLGDVTVLGDGSWSPGAVTLTNTLAVSEAVDRLNEVLAKLLPPQPPDFPNATLTVTNTAGSSPRLASGVTDNSGTSSLVGGAAVTRTATNLVQSNLFNDVGPGDTGFLTLALNGATVGLHVLTGTGDNGTYSSLVISDQKSFPLTVPGFWKSIDVAVANLIIANVGINKLSITHSAAGSTGDVYFVRDGMTAVPVISAGTVTEATAGTYAYSSSIPHYGTGGQIRVGLSIANLAGETYYGGADPLVISGTNAIISGSTLTYTNLAITTPIPRQTTAATAIGPQTIDVDGALHGSGVIQAVAKNVNGGGGVATVSTKTVLVKRGAAGAKIDENAVTVTGLGSVPNATAAVRKGGFAAIDKPTGTGSAWDSTAAIANSDATVVGGVLKNDKTNYSTGFLPAGPDLSGAGRAGSQYVTFSFQRASVSVFKINITGTYIGCWIKLPGVTDDAAIAPNALNGWLDASLSYDGSGVPGEAGDTAAGCAVGTVMGGGSGSFTITFGTQTSSNATGNEILVRLKLNANQSVTALTFSN